MMETTEGQEGLLRPLRILDLAVGAGGFCSRLLADLGASVIKVEPPGGEPSRNWGPFPVGEPSPKGSLSFQHHNANKRGITLDIGSEEGKALFLKLARKVDAVVESFSPGTFASLGLGYDVLSKAHPGLILVSLTGFGQEGPRSRYASCDLVASAFGGQMAVSGGPSTPPLKPYGDQPAYTASLFSAVSVLLALRRRDRTGSGEWIDISTQACVAGTLDHVLVRFFQEQVIPKRRGNLSWNGASFILPCRDGWLQVNIALQWETLVEWMASEGMAGELAGEVWRDEGYRRRHVDCLIDRMQAWTETHTVGELFELGQAMRFPWAPVASAGEVLQSPQLGARGFFRKMDAPGKKEAVGYPGAPYRFTPAVEMPAKQAPQIGQDNLSVYGELGLTAEAIRQLASRKVI